MRKLLAWVTISFMLISCGPKPVNPQDKYQSGSPSPLTGEPLGQVYTALVAFRYRDGEVSDVSIAKSSGDAKADQTALAAVQQATFPPPPPKYQHKVLKFVVSVNLTVDKNGLLQPVVSQLDTD